MWRRFADIPYTLLVFGIFMLELVGLGTLIWTFALRTGQLVPDVFVEQTLIAATAVTALGLLLLTAYILAYHVLSVPRERRRQQRLETWTDRWFGVLFSTEPTPTGRLGSRRPGRALPRRSPSRATRPGRPRRRRQASASRVHRRGRVQDHVPRSRGPCSRTPCARSAGHRPASGKRSHRDRPQ